MIQISFDPNALSGQQRETFEKWRQLAARAQLKLNNDVAAGRKPTFRSEVWGALKKWLLDNIYNGKCAYCEVNIDAAFVGDAEHYRPKGAVSEDRGGQLMPVSGPHGLHTGYYWIAYDWRNLIPSCQHCNSGNGKQTQFPIQGTRAYLPADGSDPDLLDALESPILLHPYDPRRNPRDHLVFTPDGAVVPRDAIGEATIKILNLDRAKLKEQRRLHITYARQTFGLQLAIAVANGNIGALTSTVGIICSSVASADKPFSAAIRDVCEVIRAKIA